MSRPVREPLGLCLTRVSRIVSRAFDDALAEAGGSLPMWLVLISLKSGQPASQRALADAIGIQGATLTHHLDAMESAGLVTRRRDPQNRRLHVVELTPAGDALFVRMRAAATAFDKRLRVGLSQPEAAQLEELLARLRDNVSRRLAAVSPSLRPFGHRAARPFFLRGLGPDQGGHRGVAAQPFQAAAAAGPDAADGDAEPGADLGVRYRRVGDQQGQQPLAIGGQVAERGAQRGVPLGHEQLIPGHRGLLVRQLLGVRHLLTCGQPGPGAPDPVAFPLGRGGEPARQRSRFAQVVQLFHQAQPDGLADVLGVGAVQLVPAADRPDQRRIPVDQRVPRRPVAVSGSCHQVDDLRIIAHRLGVLSRGCPGERDWRLCRARAVLGGCLVLVCCMIRQWTSGADSPLTAPGPKAPGQRGERSSGGELRSEERFSRVVTASAPRMSCGFPEGPGTAMRVASAASE